MKKLIALIAALIMCAAFAGCGGGSSGYGQGEQFQLGDETYALEKVVKAIDKDTSATECYGISILQVGNTAPVIISGNLNGTMTTTSALELTLHDGDTEYSPSMVNFAAIEDVEGYGSRAIFYFDLPVGAGVPASATLKSSSDDVTAELDLSGITPEEETTTTTTTTTTKPNIPVAPDAGNENYDGIGNTDVYQGIGDTEMFNADDTIEDDIAKPGL